jgi:hypothetical protein
VLTRVLSWLALLALSRARPAQRRRIEGGVEIECDRRMDATALGFEVDLRNKSGIDLALMVDSQNPRW